MNRIPRLHQNLSAFLVLFVSTTVAFCTRLLGQEQGVLHLHITDDTGQNIACRVHLKAPDGQAVRGGTLPFWNDHFSCLGDVQFPLKPGEYTYEVERGPEFDRVIGQVSIVGRRTSRVDLRLQRICHLRAQGWYSGDLHIHRPIEDVPLLMEAEDLDFGPVITWWNKPAPDARHHAKTVFRLDDGRIYTSMAGEDERQGGALLYFGLNQPLDLAVDSREYPSPMDFVGKAQSLRDDVWIDIEKPFWWDVPSWLASGQMHSIGLANNHMCRSQMYEDEAWGHPRDEARLPAPRGNGFWSQEIYYHVLNSGLRLPPSAGSASGVLPNPVGYNRVYTFLGEQPFTRDSWFQALRDGRCFVTNGPLLQAQLNESLPGTVLQVDGKKQTQSSIQIELVSNDPIDVIEILYNGRTIKQIPGRDQRRIQIATDIHLDQPGWVIIRALAAVDHTFRFASTAPWYVEFPAQPRLIRRSSVAFFQEWERDRIEQIREAIPDEGQRESVLAWHRQALEFWDEQMRAANAD